MGGIWGDIAGVLHVGICIVALLAAAAYWKFHLWWATGFGRARMGLLLSLAALTGSQSLVFWAGVDYDFNSILDDTVVAVILASTTGVLATASYMLYRTCALNFGRVRHPADAAGLGREHLRRTPLATREEIEKLIACWDEMHGSGCG